MQYCLQKGRNKACIGLVETMVHNAHITLLLHSVVLVEVGLVEMLTVLVLHSIATVAIKDTRRWCLARFLKLAALLWFVTTAAGLGITPRTVFKIVVVRIIVVDFVVESSSSLVVRNVCMVIANMCIVCRIRRRHTLPLHSNPGHQKTDLG
jgi:hypothetical protein